MRGEKYREERTGSGNGCIMQGKRRRGKERETDEGRGNGGSKD